MKHKSETITDNDIEYVVGYNYDKEDGYYAELGNPATWVQPTVFTELTMSNLKFLERIVIYSHY